MIVALYLTSRFWTRDWWRVEGSRLTQKGRGADLPEGRREERKWRVILAHSIYPNWRWRSVQTAQLLCGASGRGKGLVECFINVPQAVGPILQLPCCPSWKGNSPESIQRNLFYHLTPHIVQPWNIRHISHRKLNMINYSWTTEKKAYMWFPKYLHDLSVIMSLYEAHKKDLINGH